jgi:toxin ParE1/3/4
VKAVFSQSALADLEEILSYTATEYPSLVTSLEHRLRAVIARIEEWPRSARTVEGMEGTRVVPLVRYPFRIFYQVEQDRILILHIHHAARQPWRG